MASRIMVAFLFISVIFAGCSFYDINKRKYNELSRQHNQLANEALIKKDEAVDDYNDKNYKEAKNAAQSAKELFQSAKGVSEQNKEVAGKISDVFWLVGYQEKVIKSEDFWIEMMDKVITACDAQAKGNTALANKTVQELESRIPEYEALQKEIDKIEADHQDFFNGESDS